MLKINKINKTYKTAKSQALKDVTINVKPWEFLALLWPNWAWKSTIINSICWNVIIDSGDIEIWWFSITTNEIETKKIVWVVPQELSFDSFFTVNEILNNQSWYFWIKNNQEYIDYLLTNLHLMDKKNTNSRMLSGWMKRRLLIAKALVHRPEFFILDEPTAWVDIELRKNLYDFLRKLHKAWLTILLTTHYLEEAENLCDRIVIIHKWEILIDDKKENILQLFWWDICLSLSLWNEMWKNDFNFLENFKFELDWDLLSIKTKKDNLDELFFLLNKNEIKYQNIKIEEDKLEDIFLKLIHKSNDDK